MKNNKEKVYIECSLRSICLNVDSFYCENCINNERNECADWYNQYKKEENHAED